MKKKAMSCFRCEIIGRVLSSYGLLGYEKTCPLCKGEKSKITLCERCVGRGKIFVDIDCPECKKIKQLPTKKFFKQHGNR